MSASVQATPYQQNPISNGVLGMVLLLVTEIMFFMGLISAYIVNRAGVSDWPPIGQPRLPIEVTGVNTVFLLLSAFTLYRLGKAIGRNRKTGFWLSITLFLGFLFVAIQGYEWIQLIGFGLTTSSGIYASFFYAIIGMHGFHVLMGTCFLIYLGASIRRSSSGEQVLGRFHAVSLFWYFVVGIWPLLYYLVYIM